MKHRSSPRAFRTGALLLAAIALAGLPACGGGGGSSSSPAAATAAVDWSLTGLEPLGAGYVYEGWVIVDGAPVSTGRFNVDAGGTPSATTFALTEAQRAGATAFVLSIEPEPDADPGPAPTKILGGDFNDDMASLSIAHPAAIGDDLTGANGGFILATPTSAATDDEDQGIWFLDPNGPSASLTLPPLPAGWIYEGWVVGAGGPVSTGRFMDANAPDSDAGGPGAGAQMSPPFPGQDFITPAVSLPGQVAVISIEPMPDDSPAPFVLKPLVTDPIAPTLAPALQALMNNAANSSPTGTATLR